MSVGILIITHPGIGPALLTSAERITGQSTLATECLDIPFDCDLDMYKSATQTAIKKLDSGDGVLILTDIFAATPNNIARKIADENCRVISGLNLAMLVRLYNYANEPLEQLCEKAVEGGIRSIMQCPCN